MSTYVSVRGWVERHILLLPVLTGIFLVLPQYIKLDMKSLELYEHQFIAMGSPCKMSIYAQPSPMVSSAISMAEKEVRRLEAAYSRYRPDSLLSKINQVASTGGDIEVDEETASLLDYAEACYEDSDRLFDITSGCLSRAWSPDITECPEPGVIDRLRSSIGWEKLIWSSPRLQFSSPGLELDLGGIVKEYAADRAAEILLSQGIESGAVNLGGDIQVLGPHPDGMPWLIGIRHPRSEDKVHRFFEITRGAIASSGDYERCTIINGVRYSHIINPLTGWPTTGLASVTVISDLCVVAGSLSTIAMLKEEKGPQWLESQDIPHHWIDSSGKEGGSLLHAVDSGT